MMGVAGNLIVELWKVLGLMAPYLLFGFLMSGILSVLVSPKFVERHLGGAGILPVAKASLFGVPLPLCSCGVIPVAASLRKHGASRGATTAFLLSTPQTGADSILVTYGLLGPVFAVFRPLVALLTGILGGGLVDGLAPEKAGGEEGTSRDRGCNGPVEQGGVISRIVTYGFVTLPREIGGDLLIGLIVAALISALVPHDFFAEALGGGIGSMLVMMALGIPVYVCASASVPMAAALIAKGVSPGAAFVFLMTGPATNAASILTIRKTMGWRTLWIYLATIAFTALGWGLLLDRIFALPNVPSVAHIHEMSPGWLGVGCAVALLAVLGYGALGRRRGGRIAPAGGHTVTLAIRGMTCRHCTESVTRALLACPSVVSAEVDLKEGKARVGGDGVDFDALRRAVEALGFEVAPPDGDE